jgi:hypothetical protein
MTRKRDHACIWFTHLPRDIARELERLALDQPVQLLIDGYLTTWRRMKPGNGRPTPGIRLESGREVWNSIALGQDFSIELFQRANPQQQSNPWAQANSGPGQSGAADLIVPGQGSRAPLLMDRMILSHCANSSAPFPLEGGRMTL